MAELMFRCSLFLVFLISSLFGKSYWLCICCRNLNSSCGSRRRAGLRIGLNNLFGCGFNLCLCCAAAQLSNGCGAFSPWVLSFVFIMWKKPCNILNLFFSKKTKIKNDRKLAVSVRIKQDTQNKWSLGCLSKLPPPDQILFIFRKKYFFAGKSCSFAMNPMNFHWHVTTLETEVAAYPQGRYHMDKSIPALPLQQASALMWKDRICRSHGD